MHAARKQQAVLRMIEHSHGVEDREPLARELEWIAIRLRQVLVPPGGLVGEEADRAAEQWRGQAGRARRAGGCHVSLERTERVLTAAVVAHHPRWTVSEHRPLSHSAAADDGLEQEATRLGAERPHRRNRRRLADRELEDNGDDVVISEAASCLLEVGKRTAHRSGAMEGSSGDRGADILRDAPRRLLEVGDGCRVAEADVTFANGSERAPWEDRDSDLVEQCGGQLAIAESGRADVREHVERSRWTVTFEARNVIEELDNPIAAPAELGDHAIHRRVGLRRVRTLPPPPTA